MKNTKNSLGKVAAMLAVAGVVSWFLGAPVSSEDLGASPVGGRPDHEIVVLLKTEARERFEFRKKLTRREYNDVRFSPKRAREKAIKEAKKKLTKKRAYFEQLYGEQTSKMTRIKVLDVLLLDNRARKRISILRQAAI